MKRKKLKYCFSQSTMEYALLLGIIAAAIVGMQIYIKRGIQGRIRDLANQISEDQYEAGTTNSSSTTTQKGGTTYEYINGKTKSYQNETVTRKSEEESIYEKEKDKD
ncbi:MAG: hypothetical protein QMD94_00670 [Candidatus Omnitrophota bacterium]|nr:hypothetical protein [Candidatus Omnitrophota bacterium]